MFHALVIEDQDLMRLALMAELKEIWGDCFTVGAQTLIIAMDILRREVFDIIVIDPGLPGIDPVSDKARLSVVKSIIETSPSALHLVVTGSDSEIEAQECQKIGVAGYLAKTGLNKGMLADILHAVSATNCSIHLSRATMEIPDFHYSGLTVREQEIVDMMLRRKRGVKRVQVYLEMAERFGIDAGSAEKYYKQARRKLIKQGQLPKGI